MTDINKEDLTEILSKDDLEFLEQELKNKESENPITDEVNTTETLETPKYTEEEQEAMDMGWDPNHKGENFVSAKEFKRVGQIIKAKQEATKRALQAEDKIAGLQSAVKNLLEQNKKVAELSYKEAMEKFRKEKETAISIGDIQEVARVEQAAATYNKTMQPIVQPTVIPEPTPTFSQDELDWANENKDWFNQNNPELVEAVSGAYEMFIQQDNKKNLKRPQKEVLKEVVESIKAIPRYAALFPKTIIDKTKEAKISMVESPSRGTPSKGVSLSVDDRLQLKQIRLADPSFTESDYLKMKEQLVRKN